VLFHLATAALNQPTNTVADRKNGEARASDRPRRTARIPLIIALLIAIAVAVLGVKLGVPYTTAPASANRVATRANPFEIRVLIMRRVPRHALRTAHKPLEEDHAHR
jgi:hypothetical protein